MVREVLSELLRCAARHRMPVLFHDGTPPFASTFQIANQFFKLRRILKWIWFKK